MSATIRSLLVEKWEAHYYELQRINKTITPPHKAMDIHDEAGAFILERLPTAALETRACLVLGTSLLVCSDAS